MSGPASCRCPTHLVLAVDFVGATHPGLLGSELLLFRAFLRPAAQGRVSEPFASPRLPPSPGRFGAVGSYFPPSSRAVRDDRTD